MSLWSSVKRERARRLDDAIDAAARRHNEAQQWVEALREIDRNIASPVTNFNLCMFGVTIDMPPQMVQMIRDEIAKKAEGADKAREDLKLAIAAREAL